MLKKGLFLVLLTSLALIYQLNAQDDFSIGPRVGVNFSNVSHVDNSESLTGLALGLTSTYSLDESSGLTIDVMFSHEGYQDHLNGVNDIKFTYMQIPIYYDLFFGEYGQTFRPKIYVGLEPGFLLHAKVNDETTEMAQFNTMNLAASGGLGFNVRAGSRIWINTDLRGFLGLTEIRDKDYDPVGEKRTLNNVQLSVGVAYGLAKYE